MRFVFDLGAQLAASRLRVVFLKKVINEKEFRYINKIKFLGGYRSNINLIYLPFIFPTKWYLFKWKIANINVLNSFVHAGAEWGMKKSSKMSRDHSSRTIIKNHLLQHTSQIFSNLLLLLCSITGPYMKKYQIDQQSVNKLLISLIKLSSKMRQTVIGVG